MIILHGAIIGDLNNSSETTDEKFYAFREFNYFNDACHFVTV